MSLTKHDYYSEAAQLYRHYSTVRMTTTSFLIPLSFGLVGWGISNRTDETLLVFLSCFEFSIYTIAVFISIYFSAAQKYIRGALIEIESGTDHNTYQFLDRFKLKENINMDIFNIILISVGIIIHFVFYIYLIQRHFYPHINMIISYINQTYITWKEILQ